MTTFKIDVLIICAEADNIASGRKPGWVDKFKRFLESMLTQVTGQKLNILIKNEHDSITGANLNEVALLLPILSPQFVGAIKCMQTLVGFTQLTGNETNRVFKVIKKPLPQDSLPAKLKNRLGWDFYNIDPGSGQVSNFENFFSKEAEQTFWMKVVDLAYDIQKTLNQLKESTTPDIKPIAKKYIFLAETGHDLVSQRLAIKRELERYGYQVLPDKALPTQADPLREALRKYITKSTLSIHLIGNADGGPVEGSSLTLLELQNQVAAEKSAAVKNRSDFSRLIWISPKLPYASDRHMDYIESLKRDMASSEGAEILQTPLEDFKNMIREELIEIGFEKKLTLSRTEKNRSKKLKVYLIYDLIDQQAILPLKAYIKDFGFEVLEPSFQGEPLELRESHILNLKTFDGAIIFQEKVSTQWVKMKLLDLFKSRGFGRVKPALGKAVISSHESNIDLGAFRKHNITLIKGAGTQIQHSLQVFLEDIQEQVTS